MRLSRPEPLRIWVSATSGPPPADALVVGDADAAIGSETRWMAMGRYVAFRAASSTRRVDLLNYLWQLAPRANWIGAVLAVAGVLLLAGTLICLRAAPGQHLWIGPGAGCVALAIGVLYAVLVPPFEAPDEPDHFLAFAELNGRADLAGRPPPGRVWTPPADRGHVRNAFVPSTPRSHAVAWDAESFPSPSPVQRTTSAWTLIARHPQDTPPPSC